MNNHEIIQLLFIYGKYNRNAPEATRIANSAIPRSVSTKSYLFSKTNGDYFILKSVIILYIYTVLLLYY